MDALNALFVIGAIVAALVIFDVLALRFGADSRDLTEPAAHAKTGFIS